MSKESKIPYNRPFIVGKELEYISQAVMEHRHISGNGPFTQKCQAWLEHNLSCAKTLLTHSCTAALEMAAILFSTQGGKTGMPNSNRENKNEMEEAEPRVCA